MDNLMRRKAGHVEWCMPFNRSIGLVKLNFTTGGLIAGPTFVSMVVVSDYSFQRLFSYKEILIGLTATKSFLRYHFRCALIMATVLLFIYGMVLLWVPGRLSWPASNPGCHTS